MPNRRIVGNFVLSAALGLAFLAGCASSRISYPDEFREFLRVRGPVPENALLVTFFEVGLGDAVLLEFPSGKRLLVDAGIGWYVQSILNYFRARTINELDGLLLTHPHRDHFGGMKEIVEALPVRRFFYNGVDPGNKEYSGLLETLHSKRIPLTVLRRGDELTDFEGPETRVEVLYPDEKALTLRSDFNGGSIVLRVTYGHTTFLLTGDAENPEEARLLEFEDGKLRADVLKLGHHGSIGSGSTVFLKTVQPRVAVVQGTRWVDFHPFYPRPSYHIRWTLASMKVPLLKTKHEGAVQIISDGKTIRWRTIRRMRAAAQNPYTRRNEERKKKNAS